MKRKAPLKLEPRDLQAALELRNALIAVEELPYKGRWQIALELLPDMFFYHLMSARDRRQQDQMNLYGPLALVAIDELFGEKPNDEVMVIAVYGIVLSGLAELERRHKHFCKEIVFMEDLFDYNSMEPIKFVPKDPETFTMEAMIAYYREMSREKLAENG